MLVLLICYLFFYFSTLCNSNNPSSDNFHKCLLFRLPAPMDCPEAIHQLMLDCWQKERAHRPSFSSIVKTLDKLICCPETLRKIAASQACNPLAPDAPDLTQFSTVDEWLLSLKMSRYSDNFAAAGVVSMDQVTNNFKFSS